MSWYVVKTKPKKEETVLHQLQGASVPVFLPRLKSMRSRGPGHVLLKPLFPSYVFVNTDLQDPQRNRLVRFTRGVSRILGDEEGPRPVSEGIIETLRERTRDGFLIEQELLYKEGDEVRVKKGILMDLIGIIEKNIPDSGRVKILFKWLNGPMRAVLKCSELEKAA